MRISKSFCLQSHYSFSSTSIIFQRLSMPTIEDKNQPSTSGNTWLSTFKRLSTISKKVNNVWPTPTTRAFALDKLSMIATRSQKWSPTLVLGKACEVKSGEKICSAIASRMKRKLLVSINTKGSLKLKWHDVIITHPKENDQENEEDATSCFHVTIEEASGSWGVWRRCKRSSSITRGWWLINGWWVKGSQPWTIEEPHQPS